MEIYIERQDEHIKKRFNGKAVDLLKQLKINPVTIVLVQNGRIVPEQVELKDTDKIEILEVVSGG
ncbi:MoaD/ThiS family protein [Candidatus Woesearchaeota archaeon]|nr:MoaD/ThiS family protein [Candidatus Woesearchaeota archaeon]